VFESGSPNGLVHRTFRATFEMPVFRYNHNLFKNWQAAVPESYLPGEGMASAP